MSKLKIFLLYKKCTNVINFAPLKQSCFTRIANFDPSINLMCNIW